MTEEQLKQAVGTSLRVEWRGLRNWERVTGTISALIYRRHADMLLLSVEIADSVSPNHVLICRADDVYPLGTTNDWQTILGGNT